MSIKKKKRKRKEEEREVKVYRFSNSSLSSDDKNVISEDTL